MENAIILLMLWVIPIAFMFNSIARQPMIIDNLIVPKRNFKKKGVVYGGLYVRRLTKYAWLPIKVQKKWVFLRKYGAGQKYLFHNFWGWRWITVEKWLV